jgi:putative phosphoesterase
VAFIADVHSNIEALEAVLSRIGEEEVYCLGDMVGYGANPNEVIDLLKERGVVTIAGNHDYAVATGDTAQFNARAAMAVLWTRNRLDKATLAFLRDLPLQRRVELEGVSVGMVHGSPDDPLWEYVHPATHEFVFTRYLDKAGADVLALGHTHVPFVWKGGGRLVFNPGSVGQPRNGDRRASFARLLTGGGKPEVQEVKVEYDCERAAAKIRDAGLPDQLASRLLLGV